MAQAKQETQSRLTPSPKALQAQRMADAFGVKVPGLKPKAPRNVPHSG